MAMGIVHRFEIVQINRQQAKSIIATLGLTQDTHESLLKIPAIGQAGEFVVHRHVPHRLLGVQVFLHFMLQLPIQHNALDCSLRRRVRFSQDHDLPRHGDPKHHQVEAVLRRNILVQEAHRERQHAGRIDQQVVSWYHGVTQRAHCDYGGHDHDQDGVFAVGTRPGHEKGGHPVSECHQAPQCNPHPHESLAVFRSEPHALNVAFQQPDERGRCHQHDAPQTDVRGCNTTGKQDGPN